MDFIHEGIRFMRGFEYEVKSTPKILEFIKVGYLKEVIEIEVKEVKQERKTKEYKGTKKTK